MIVLANKFFKTVNCPGDGIGIHAGLRSRILGVRVSSGAPTNTLVLTLHAVGLLKKQVVHN